MKMIMAIVNRNDGRRVSSALTGAGHSVTKLSTKGGFLLSGNTTFLIGAEDDKVDEIIKIIEKQSSRRTRLVPATAPYDGVVFRPFPVEVMVGGATIFVLPVDRFEKV